MGSANPELSCVAMTPEDELRVTEATKAYVAALETWQQFTSKEQVWPDAKPEHDALKAECERAEREYRDAWRVAGHQGM